MSSGPDVQSCRSKPHSRISDQIEALYVPEPTTNHLMLGSCSVVFVNLKASPMTVTLVRGNSASGRTSREIACMRLKRIPYMAMSWKNLRDRSLESDSSNTHAAFDQYEFAQR